MIEKIVLDHLNGALTVPAFAEAPSPAPERYVLVEKTGSGSGDRLSSAMIACQSYAPSLYEAAKLNEEVKAAMAEIVTLGAVARCRLNTDYNFTDTTKKQYRYQAVFDLTHY